MAGHRLRLPIDGPVVLPEELAALGVTDDRVGDVERREHRAGDLAGERALVLVMDVLCSEAVGSRSESINVWTERSAVNGGQITTSTRSASSRSSRYESFCTAWIASRCVLCIFQFAAIIGVRPATSVLQDRDAGERRPSRNSSEAPPPVDR